MRILNLAKVIVRRSSDGNYLVLRSSKWEERPDRSEKPDLAGGMVEPGESIIGGAVRELQEEAGLSIQPEQLELVYAETFRSSKDGASINRSIFFVEVDGDPEVTISWEHDEYWWASASELQTMEIREPYPKIFAYLADIGVLR